MSGNSSQPGRSVISKFSAILMTFRQGGSHSLSEIAGLSGLPISTTHRMVNDLADWLLLEKDPDGRTYRPGVALRSLVGGPFCGTHGIRERAAPWLEDLHRAVGADIRLGLLQLGAVSYIEKRRNCAVTHFSAAATLPVHATAAGKVLLAFTSDRELRSMLNRRLIRFTPRTIVDADSLRWALRTTRANGFGCADRELHPARASIAAPVFGSAGRIVAALEVDIADPAIPSDGVRPALSVAAAGLSREFERPCERCQSPVAAGEHRPDLTPPGSGRGPRRPPSPVQVPIADGATVQWFDRRATDGSATAR